MPHEVIMPALGMAQDTGLIVSWLKRPGDPVAVGEPLMEVETDKATMEVEAQADGYLTDLRYDAGQDVPVGEVIALISDSPEGSGAAPPAPDRPAAAPEPAPQKAATPPPGPAPEPGAPAPALPPHPALPPRADGRILASPRARRLAAEQGLDLSRLVAAGHPQPYHAADLEALRALPDVAAMAPAHSASRITAALADPGVAGFLDWAETETGAPPDRGRLYAGFAAAALRRARGDGGALIVEVIAPPAQARRLPDPDHGPGPDHSADTGIDAPLSLILRDLSGGPITGLRLGWPAVPTLTVTEGGGGLTLTLDFAPDALTGDQAIDLMTGFAGRLADPMRHLL